MAPPTPFPSNTGRGPAQLPVRGKRQRQQVHFKESKAGSRLQAPGSAAGSSEQTHLWMGKLKLRKAMNLLKPSLAPMIEDTRDRRVGVEWPPSHIPPGLPRGARYHQHPTTSPGRKLCSANHLPGPARPTKGTKAEAAGEEQKESPHPDPRRAQTRVASRIWLQGQDHRDQDTQTGVPAQS